MRRLHPRRAIFTSLIYLGAAYLLSLAWPTRRGAGPVTIERRGRRGAGSFRIISTGFLINILNPKLSIFFLAFLPQFVDAGSPSWLGDLLPLAVVFIALPFRCFLVSRFLGRLLVLAAPPPRPRHARCPRSQASRPTSPARPGSGTPPRPPGSPA